MGQEPHYFNVFIVFFLVYKEKEKPFVLKKKEAKPLPQPVFIPVVGANDEPELKPAGLMEGQKRKTDHSQMPSDDYHYDKFKKKIKRF